MDLDQLPIRTAPGNVLIEIERADILGERYSARGKFIGDAYHHGYLHIGTYLGWSLYGGEGWRPCYERQWLPRGRAKSIKLQDDQVLSWAEVG